MGRETPRPVPAREVVATLADAPLDEARMLVERYAEDPRKQVIHAVASTRRRIEREDAERDRVAEMYRLQREVGGPGVIIGVDEVGRGALAGPLTNLATALRRAPELARELPRVTFMGGSLALPGNVTPYAEANVANDPEAADLVLHSGLLTRMVGLDVTHQVVLTREETAAWRELGTPAGRLFADMTDHYIAIYEQNNPQMGGCALHDPPAVAAAVDPTLVGCLPANLRVDLEGAARGRTVCDPNLLRDAEKTCEVALTVDAPRFLAEFRARVRRALSR